MAALGRWVLTTLDSPLLPKYSFVTLSSPLNAFLLIDAMPFFSRSSFTTTSSRNSGHITSCPLLLQPHGGHLLFNSE